MSLKKLTMKRLQWRNRLAHGTYKTVTRVLEKCRGCEFEPHLEHMNFAPVVPHQ